MKFGAAIARRLVRDIGVLPGVAQVEAWRRVLNETARAGVRIGFLVGAAVGAATVAILCTMADR